jgi:membrane-associated phospholipid phosphatase
MWAAAILITGLGDAALLLPAATTLLLYLLWTRSWRAATAFIGALSLCIVLTVACKMIFHACAGHFLALIIRSPSGHTSLSTTFYGCGALMIAADRRWDRRLAVMLVGVALVVAIAASRIVLRAHTIEEVVAGFAIGIVCMAFYSIQYLPQTSVSLDWRLPVAGVGILALLTHGEHVSVETLIDRVADHIRLAQYVCPLQNDANSIPPAVSFAKATKPFHVRS